jgi:hypothetical protein
MCSVLMHLLPGLAMFAHTHFPDPPQLAAQLLRRRGSAEEHVVALPVAGAETAFVFRFSPGSFFWLFIMPMLFYLAWQLIYFLVVQVSDRDSHCLKIMYGLPCMSSLCTDCSSMYGGMDVSLWFDRRVSYMAHPSFSKFYRL